MRLPRPKSLSSLMLTGFALVSVPLLLAVVIAATKVRDLSEESAALVRSGVETTHYTQQLFQQIASIERSAKLYQVLNDPGLLQVYRDSRERLLVTLNNIETAAADSVRRTQLQALRQSLRRVDGALLRARARSAGARARRGRSDCTDVGSGVRAVRLDRRAHRDRPVATADRRRRRRSNTCSGSRRC